jgi:hypothetical protein
MRKPDAALATRLTQANKREAKGAAIPPAPLAPLPRNICRGCGKALSRGSIQCLACSVEVSRRKMLEVARQGRIVSKSRLQLGPINQTAVAYRRRLCEADSASSAKRQSLTLSGGSINRSADHTVPPATFLEQKAKAYNLLNGTDRESSQTRIPTPWNQRVLVGENLQTASSSPNQEWPNC